MNSHVAFDAADVETRLVAAFEANRGADAVPMAKYMRDRFPFLGIKSPQRRALQREALKGLPRPSEAELKAVALALWQRPEREYQYAACDLLERHARICGPEFLGVVERLITAKSWWDTVDALALVAGALVAAYPALTVTMDRWIVSDDFWLARSAITHQLRFKDRTDADRLFRYCVHRSRDREFFIRKGIGWALREYSKADAAAVRTFVAKHPELSPLSRREALLWLNGGRSGGPPRG